MDCRKWIEGEAWLAYLIPQAKNVGAGPLSFVSTVTGLNLAIVKLQSFLKSQEDAQARWTAEAIKRAMDNRPELNADEPTNDSFKRAVQEKSKKYVSELNASNLKWWAMWNRWAVRVTILGFLCLIFGYSAGILVLPMLAPVVATWILGRLTSEGLFNKIDTVCDLAADFVSRLRIESGRTLLDVEKRLKEAAVPELPLKIVSSSSESPSTK